eukprot:TRINITY_DN2548_c0_g1_i6.p1 TRINITY_DN2548_c0_g1~~TRINITY_DN2548_c0_g1_i6.p1  ORF type:complete len:321 (+),score=12.88 TRINITY_DN2548_c0_g1_i6:319-1281(+)
MPPVALSRSQRDIVQRVVKVEPSAVDQSGASTLEPVISAPEHFCRICYESDLIDSPLIAPCSCRGSLENVHLKCLLDWREYMRDTGQMVRYYRCEICRNSYNIPEELLPLKPSDFSWWISKTQQCCQSASEIARRLLNSDLLSIFLKVWRCVVLGYAGIQGVQKGLLWSHSVLKHTALHWDAASQLLNQQVPALMLLAFLYPGVQQQLAIAFLGLQALLGLYVISSLVVGGLAGAVFGCVVGTLSASSWSLNAIIQLTGMGANFGGQLMKFPISLGFRGLKLFWRIITSPLKFQSAELNRSAGIQLYKYTHGYGKFNAMQ